jgi:hypothetical protein
VQRAIARAIFGVRFAMVTAMNLNLPEMDSKRLEAAVAVGHS